MKNVYCTIETPKGSNAKYDYDPELGGYLLTKYLPLGFSFPFDFGFIPGTLGEDGDPLDVIVISEQGSFSGCMMECRVIGAIKAVQTELDGQRMENDRYLVIPETSTVFKNIVEAKQLPDSVLDELKNFFISYNQQAGKSFNPFRLMNSNQGLKTIEKSRNGADRLKRIEIFIPVFDEKGKPFPEKFYRKIKKKLTDDFGGMTAYTQMPADGIWKDEKEKEVKDQIVVYEVMASKIDKAYWKAYKTKLSVLFKQNDLVIRQSDTGLL